MSQISIHGHEVMQLIHESTQPLTRAELTSRVKKRFGPNALFHTCADQAMTLDRLLEFLRHRGKVVEIDGRLRTDIGLMCDHSD